jgi:hypothetical protein
MYRRHIATPVLQFENVPAAYQKGPDTPKDHATFADCSSVAAHVHFATMSQAVRPALILRPAVEKFSESFEPPPNFLYFKK